MFSVLLHLCRAGGESGSSQCRTGGSQRSSKRGSGYVSQSVISVCCVQQTTIDKGLCYPADSGLKEEEPVSPEAATAAEREGEGGELVSSIAGIN